MLIGMGFRGMGLSSGACFEDPDLVGSRQGAEGMLNDWHAVDFGVITSTEFPLSKGRW